MLIHDRIYGKIEITDPLAIELIKSPSFQRLKYIAQMGVYQYALPKIDTTRYEHSIGVYYLLIKFGASREEQIAGLLHDVSHTAFSHVVDHLYGDNLKQESQDKRHKGFILNSEIPAILKKHKMKVNLIANHHDWPLLDQYLPDLCADRLEYGIRDAYVCGVIKLNMAKRILKDLKIIDKRWVFVNLKTAKDYFNNSLQMAQNWWAPDWGILQFTFMAKALRIGLKRELITEKDLFTTDNKVWNKLKKSKDKQVLKNLNYVRNIAHLKYRVQKTKTDISLQSKYRGVDPLVQTDDTIKRVSNISPKYLREKIDKLKSKIESVRYAQMLE